MRRVTVGMNPFVSCAAQPDRTGCTACIDFQQLQLLQGHLPPMTNRSSSINHITTEIQVLPSTLLMMFMTSLVFILSTLRRLSIMAIDVFKIPPTYGHGHTSMVWADNHIVRTNHTTTPKIIHQSEGAPSRMIHRNIKESLNLRRMQVDGQ